MSSHTLCAPPRPPPTFATADPYFLLVPHSPAACRKPLDQPQRLTDSLGGSHPADFIPAPKAQLSTQTPGTSRMMQLRVGGEFSSAAVDLREWSVFCLHPPPPCTNKQPAAVHAYCSPSPHTMPAAAQQVSCAYAAHPPEHCALSAGPRPCSGSAGNPARQHLQPSFPVWTAGLCARQQAQQ